MQNTAHDHETILCDDTIRILHRLSLSVHRLGYKALTIAIPRYAMDDTQSMTKELYPYVAKQLGYRDWYAVEHLIRGVILDAWQRRNPNVWEEYFPGQRKQPTNKQFIAMLAERLR